jgi:predicted phage terminase large subunit-like protein
MAEVKPQALQPEMVAKIKLNAEKSLFFFAKFILGYDWLTPAIHLPLCRMISDYQTNLRVKVTLPRSWLKSTVCSISYPLWRAFKDPNIRILLTQNSMENAKAKLRAIRDHVTSNEWFKVLWPEVLPDKSCRWQSESLELKRTKSAPEGTFEAAGRGTQVVGRHYHLIIEDDTVAPDKDDYTNDNVLPSKEDIEQAIGWHRAAVFLLVDHNVDQMLVVGTRWFELDLLSWIDKNELWYQSYVRACRETDGKPDPDGILVWSEKYNDESLRRLEATVGPYLFSCLYLNTPLRSEDMIFQKGWFQAYDIEPRNLAVTITVDPAGNPKNSTSKRKKKNDFNVLMVCGKAKNGRCYVLEYIRFRGSPGQLIDHLFELVSKYKKSLRGVGVEGIAYQESLEYFISEEMRAKNLHFNLELLKHGGRSKEFRIRALQPLVRAGTLLFRPWMTELLAELEVFPLGANDDLADALAMQLQMWDATVAIDESEAQPDESPTDFQSVLRNHLQQYRPQTGSVFDVLTTVHNVNGVETNDPYGHLWNKN